MSAIAVDGHFRGTVNIYWIDENTNWLEVGVVISDNNDWESGIGTEVFKIWIDYLFKQNFIHRLGISIWSCNRRMIKLAEKVGMQEEVCIREAKTVNG